MDGVGVGLDCMNNKSTVVHYTENCSNTTEGPSAVCPCALGRCMSAALSFGFADPVQMMDHDFGGLSPKDAETNSLCTRLSSLSFTASTLGFK